MYLVIDDGPSIGEYFARQMLFEFFGELFHEIFHSEYFFSIHELVVNVLSLHFDHVESA
jgi:hypothetical protein